jgi:hypothetical protein
VVLHGGRLHFLDLIAGLFPLLFNKVGNGGNGFSSHGSFSFDVGVMREDLTEKTLLVERFDCLDYLAFSMIAILDQVAEEQAHLLNYSLECCFSTYNLKKRIFIIKLIKFITHYEQ